MNNFRYCKPTRVIFGAGEFKQLGVEAVKYGKKALLVKDAGPLEELGVYEQANAFLSTAGMTVYQLSGVTSNPRLTKIDEGIALAKAQKIDIVIGIGGGSTIDTAKAIALGAVYEGDVWDFFSAKATPGGSLPVGVVTTLAGTGSETDDTTVVSYDRSLPHEKWDCFSYYNYPRFAIMDPELHVSVPRSLTAAGMADAISHASEAYFFDYTQEPFLDQYVEGLVNTIISCEKVLSEPDNLALRGLLCWTTALAIDGLGNAGRRFHPITSWPGHLILAGITAVTNTHHGKGMAVMLPACCAAANRENPVKTARFAREVFGVEQKAGMSDAQMGCVCVERMRELYRRWGLPVSLRELGVREEQLPEIVQVVMRHPGRGQVTPAYVEAILTECF